MQLAYANGVRVALPKVHISVREYNATRSDGEYRQMNPTQEESRSQQQGNMPPPLDRRWEGYNPQIYGDRRKPKLFDATINIPTVMAFVGMIVTVIGFGISLYSTFDKRMSTLENSDREQEAHFVRLEAANQEFRSDTKNTLNDINGKVGQVRDWMLQDGRVANRPDAQPWTRK